MTHVSFHHSANHIGYFEFRLCPNNNIHKAATQQCLDQYVLPRADGRGTKTTVIYKEGVQEFIDVKLRLPAGLTCEQCVFQWLYNTGELFELTHLPLDKIADNFKCIFLNGNDKIPIQISLKHVPRSPIDNNPALVRTGNKPLHEPMFSQFTDAYMQHYGRWVHWTRQHGLRVFNCIFFSENRWKSRWNLSSMVQLTICNYWFKW